MRALAGKMQNERAAAAESEDAARHDENALGQPEEPPAVKAGSRLEVLVLVTCAQDDGTSKDYDQWLAVEVVAAADGTAAYKKATATGQMRKLNVGWFFVRYEDDGAEEWLRLNEASFNNRARGSWRVDLDFEATAAGSGPAGEAGDGDDAEECGDGNGGDEEDENDEEDEEDEEDEDSD